MGEGGEGVQIRRVGERKKRKEKGGRRGRIEKDE